MGRKKSDSPLENNNDGFSVEIVEDGEKKIVQFSNPIENNKDGIATDLSEEDHGSVKAEIEERKIPKMEDIEWEDWVMSQFEPTELDDGYPKVNGLRRLVEKIHGPIIDRYPKTIQVPTPQNMMRATVEYYIEVLKKKNLEPGEQPYRIKCADVADAYIDNIKGDMFVVFPTANASTRAEVRALRKMLSIGKAAAEELADPNFTSSAAGEIPDSLVTKIDIKCATLGIDVMKYINMGRGKPGKPDLFTDIKEVSFALGQRMFKLLNEYQQKISSGEDPRTVIPAKITPYQPNWR